MIKIAILTISDKGSRGERKDTSSLVIREMVKKIGEVIAYDLVPDEKDMIIERLKYFCDDLKVDLVLTTGGTGFSPRDVTPEATKAVIEKEVPGIPEAMRIFSFKKSPLSVLSREIAGIRKGTLIVNLPGSPKGVRENLEVVVDQLVHGIKILRGEKLDLAKEE
ncbi:molybdenum cofactor synthesis domain-containing protein [Mesoaciditoga lauensis]|uniref:molybdenum cofactor synthesis domain-containing protein n=1 Tax=Mesoaciditoga lauensis TaxID=1495039 RepID=UPI000567A181